MVNTRTEGPSDDRIRDLIERLELEEKVELLTGRDFWSTLPIEKIGLRSMLLSDGPSGVRGETWDERSPSLNLPSATALSSSWDPAIAYRYGVASAAEARRKGVDVVLGPTINLHRSPLGGRHFEAFSEDPVLTGELAASYVRGVQDNGVGACVKHYVANDFETDRFTADVQVSDRALRELYLLAFEKAVVDARVWTVMSAYNSINGTTATENELLEDPLNSEWGFDGVVVSDWTAVRSIASAMHSQDLVMPGPDGPWGRALVEAVRRGDVAMTAIDRKVERILRLAAHVGALDGFEPSMPRSSTEDGLSFAREAAAEGTVLLRNTGILPLDPSTVGRIAVIGHNADQARTQGGGSATVVPERIVSPLEGIRAAFPNASVEYSLGAVVQDGVAAFHPDCTKNPSTGDAGAHIRFLDHLGDSIYEEDRFTTELVYFGGTAPIRELSTFELTTFYTPQRTERARLGFAGVGTGRIYVDGELLGELTAEAVGTDLGAALLSPPPASIPVQLTQGKPAEIRIEFRPAQTEGAELGALGLTVGLEASEADPKELLAQAARAAADADVAIVVVGTNAKVESEGYDRTSLSLPGRQDDLVAAVIAANPRTIVLVNSGSPVLMPWREETEALLVTYFGGQEYGNAVGDVLTGIREPGGRLPTTWPALETDVPVIDVTPVDGVLCYDEGIHIGYRAWLKAGKEPAFPFGFGLGYTSWEVENVTLHQTDSSGAGRITADVRNTGDRRGKQVIQVYASRPDSRVDRPVRWFVGSSVVRADVGQEVRVEIPFSSRAFADWADGWHVEPGEYTLEVGLAVDDLQHRVDIAVGGR
ncbi:glycosyl hydrolase [Pseudoclavibacter sp. RFBG4]|uniref:beta-glucosidase n=1 Tax=Pseudoclavibacter sp. RFBG4 TaxID=2080575 RepID=UPI000CE92F0B|nr:glycosyl hydrolase [Pseudoclavibacter sp. RFBG4]